MLSDNDNKRSQVIDYRETYMHIEETRILYVKKEEMSQ